jgi:MaoC dehydratase-like protein
VKLNMNAIGLATEPVQTTVEQGRIDALCTVLNDTSPVFTKSWRGGAPLAPPTFINCFREGKSNLLINHLGVDMPKLLHGEQRMNYYAPIRPGDVIVQQLAIVDVRERATRAMGPADFFTVRIWLSSTNGDLLHEAYQSFFVRHQAAV